MPTVDGDVEMKLPKGLQPNDRQVMRRRGVKKLRAVTNDDKGDQWVTFKVALPKSLSVHQLELLKQAFAPKEPQQSNDTQVEDEKQEKKENMFSRAFKKIKSELCDEPAKEKSSS